MWTPRQFKIACGSAAAVALVFTFVIGRSSPPVVVPVKAIETVPAFDETWRGAAVPLAIKSKETQVAANKVVPPEESKPVRTEKIIPEIVSLPTDTSIEDKPKTKKQKHHRTSHDICRGKGKYSIHNGRSWRCNR